MINFNEAPRTKDEEKYILDAINSGHIHNNGKYTKLCQELLEKKLGSKCVLLTTSGTMALELAMMAIGLKPGDEVVLPSYTFSTTATSILRTGAIPVFIDCKPGNMCIDEDLIEPALTDKTKAICIVHYAGMCCDIEKVLEITKKHNLYVVEDAAQVMNAKYKGKYLGTWGDIGCFSFHATKNYSMGEGGCICVNNPKIMDNINVVRECGTNRTKFINGQVDKYSWIDLGSSFSPSELNAAYLYPQLLIMDEMNKDRVDSFYDYYNQLKPLEEKGLIELPVVSEGCEINGHMFYLKTKDLDERMKLQTYLREKGIASAFHYVPLHSSPAGKKYCRFVGEDKYTTKEFNRLLRLPMYYGLKKEDIKYICDTIKEFYK